MANPVTQDLKNIVDVVVEVSPLAVPRPTFNQGLIVGPSAVISAAERVRLYEEASAMLTDGFTNGSPEYLGALLYFGQSPAPQKLWVGRQDLTTGALWNVNIHAGAGGTNYKKGDVITVSGGAGGQLTVDTVDANGAVTAFHISAYGSGYVATVNEATTGGSGTLFAVDITSVGESPLVALQACRAANNQWYCGTCTDAAKADHELIAAWVQSAAPSTIYMFTTADADCITTAGTDIFSALKGLNYNRVFGQYSTQNQYAVAAAMGYAMGQNTGLNNSAFTLKFKQEVGVLTEALTPTKINTLEGNNGNVYLSYADEYTILEQGVMANGQFFDEILNLDMLASNIQLNVMDVLYQSPKVPQTDGGVNRLIHAVNQACDSAVNIGFLAPGMWTGDTVLNLVSGQMLPKGYLVQAPPVSSQSTADRQARKSPPIYVAVKEAGAVHSVLIGVYVNR